ncbi:hypothetical protein RE628_11400 [Paenibacillus sp. D2_2]|uniref:hypothetical protein n=1 Tax=Paenibacillus sp. D2_2 TaxID=3073092 RepID=UPI002815FB2B|nr:hypothetical protein [Paenibacillus sp. D2_2]WMT42833.1 hypothetical protein RE628_11400 [Paenibacillus sp. D2_2]
MTRWVWTQKAQEIEPKRHKAGEMVWPQYAKKAPKQWLEDGLIVDKTEYVKEGQTEIFDFM